MYGANSQTISFDLHDTILVFKFGGKLIRKRLFRAVFYFLSNFRLFILIYTFFCRRNEQIIELMRQSEMAGNKVIVLTSTYKKSAKIIYYFLRKNNITSYDEVIFRKSLFQKQGDYKIEEIIKNNISLHYDDNEKVCSQLNTQGRACVVVTPWYNK